MSRQKRPPTSGKLPGPCATPTTRCSAKRDATDEEIAEAEAVLNSMVVPMIDILMGNTNARPMLVAGDGTEQRALPEASRTTPRGVTVVESAEEPIVAGPPAGTPVPQEVGATAPTGEPPVPPTNGNGRVGLRARGLRSRVRTASEPGGDE